MENRFFICREGKTHGPFSESQLRSGLISKKLSGDDLVCENETGPLKQLRLLFNDTFPLEYVGSHAVSEQFATAKSKPSPRTQKGTPSSIASPAEMTNSTQTKPFFVSMMKTQEGRFTFIGIVCAALLLANVVLGAIHMWQLSKIGVEAYWSQRTLESISDRMFDSRNHLSVMRGHLEQVASGLDRSLFKGRGVFHERVEWGNLDRALRAKEGRADLVGFHYTPSDPYTGRVVYDLMWSSSDAALVDEYRQRHKEFVQKVDDAVEKLNLQEQQR